VTVVGFHGQTVLHRPQQRLTVQLGDGVSLAVRLGIPVVYDLHAADVAAGGEGAPLAPVFHRAFVAALGRELPLAVLNIGGVANVTYIASDGLIACDTGPGNALLDDFVRVRTGQLLDNEGRIAAAGTPDENAIAQFLAHSCFAKPPPKSLDRNEFRRAAGAVLNNNPGIEAGAATLTALTAAAVARVVPLLPRPPKTDRFRRRRAQSDANARARRAIGAGAGSSRVRGGLVRRFPRSAGLRLSRGAQPTSFAHHVSRHTGVGEPRTGGVLANP
jgi:anhydro-N-acetylmuramic acid kinase